MSEFTIPSYSIFGTNIFVISYPNSIGLASNLRLQSIFSRTNISNYFKSWYKPCAPFFTPLFRQTPRRQLLFHKISTTWKMYQYGGFRSIFCCIRTKNWDLFRKSSYSVEDTNERLIFKTRHKVVYYCPHQIIVIFYLTFHRCLVVMWLLFGNFLWDCLKLCDIFSIPFGRSLQSAIFRNFTIYNWQQCQIFPWDFPRQILYCWNIHAFASSRSYFYYSSLVTRLSRIYLVNVVHQFTADCVPYLFW